MLKKKCCYDNNSYGIYFTSTSSTSKISFEFGGILGGAPATPYLQGDKSSLCKNHSVQLFSDADHSPLLGRNTQPSLPPNLHAFYPFFPPSDDLSLAQPEHEGLATASSVGVKHLAIVGQAASVPYKHLQQVATAGTDPETQK